MTLKYETQDGERVSLSPGYEALIKAFSKVSKEALIASIVGDKLNLLYTEAKEAVKDVAPDSIDQVKTPKENKEQLTTEDIAFIKILGEEDKEMLIVRIIRYEFGLPMREILKTIKQFLPNFYYSREE